MRCPSLTDLPEPPPGKTGWPWTLASTRSPVSKLDVYDSPKITIITPSFNQGRFVEETIRSVLLQGYPNLEYFVIDGGSTDGSVEVIKKYSPWLSYWRSEPDSGQSDAINHGLKLASGLLATWINSDDMLCKNALVDHVCRYGFQADTVYVGYCTYIDESGEIISLHRGRVHSFEDLVRIGKVWRAADSRGHIDQPAVLFPRALALSVGGLNTENHFTMDYELWGQFFLAGAKFHYTNIRFGIFREQLGQKTYDILRQTRSLVATAAKLIKMGNCFSDPAKKELLGELERYLGQYEKDFWRGTGRLARIGLPVPLVTKLRKLKAAVQNTFIPRS